MSHHHLGTASLSWTVMMVAMMLPTAIPAIGMFGNFARKRMSIVGSAAPTALFVLGYTAIWIGFSIIAAMLQSSLANSHIVASTAGTPLVTASVLMLAGAFQLSSFKQACLTQCRSPIPFFLAHWRDGNRGAFAMGARHGSYCLGCCIALMGLMFVSGAMNLLWMAALSLFMLAEKIAPARWDLGRRAGVLFITWGVIMIL